MVEIRVNKRVEIGGGKRVKKFD